MFCSGDTEILCSLDISTDTVISEVLWSPMCVVSVVSLSPLSQIRPYFRLVIQHIESAVEAISERAVCLLSQKAHFKDK